MSRKNSLHVRSPFFRQPYCHTLSGRFSPFSKGEMLSVFFILCFLCLVRCLLSFFTVLLVLGSLFEKIFGSELLFLGVVVGLVFFDSVLPMFLFYNLVFLIPKMSRKNSLHVRSLFFWQPYCHTLSGRFSPSRRGKCCPFSSFLFFCVWFGVFCRFLLFFSS